MKVRYGWAESVIDSGFIVQEKRWWGWKTIKNYSKREYMEDFITGLKEQRVLCIEMN